RKTHRHPELESTLRQYYSQNLVDGNLRMADIPGGARLIGGTGRWFPTIAVENVYIFPGVPDILDRKSTRLNSSHSQISYAVFCLLCDSRDLHSFLHDALPIS